MYHSTARENRALNFIYLSSSCFFKEWERRRKGGSGYQITAKYNRILKSNSHKARAMVVQQLSIPPQPTPTDALNPTQPRPTPPILKCHVPAELPNQNPCHLNTRVEKQSISPSLAPLCLCLLLSLCLPLAGSLALSLSLSV